MDDVRRCFSIESRDIHELRHLYLGPCQTRANAHD